MTFEQQVTDSKQHHEEERAISTNGTNGGAGEMMEGLRIHKNWKHDSYCLCSECVF